MRRERYWVVTVVACVVLLAGCAGPSATRWGAAAPPAETGAVGLWDQVTELAASGGGDPAPAVYLACDGETWFTYERGNFATTEKRNIRIAVLDARRAEWLADVRIPFSGKSTVKDIRASTTLKDGTVHRVRGGDIHERSGYADYTLYADRKEKVFAMPALADSCILEYSFVRTEYGVRLEDIFEFQQKLPARRVTYSYAFPNDLMSVGGLELSTSGSDRLGLPRRGRVLAGDEELSTLTWTRDNLPSRVSEPLMPGPSETGARIYVYPSHDRVLGTITWKVVGDEYYDAVIGQLVEPNDDLAALAREWSAGAVDDAGRVERIGNEVAKRIRYVSVPLAGEGWEPQPPLQTVRNGYGDCKDMSVLAIAALRALGIEAHPVVLRTRDSGALDVGSVVTSQFNHMIVHARAGSQDYWFDPTAGSFCLGELPWQDRGVHGLLVSKDSSALVTLPEAMPLDNMVTTTADLNVDAAGVLTGTVTRQYTGEFALMLRNISESASQGDVERILTTELREMAPGAQLLEWDLDCGGSRGCTATLAFRSESCVQTSGDMLICVGSLFCAPFPLEEPLAEPRHHDVVFERPAVFRHRVDLDVPDGWLVRSLPDFASTDIPHGSVSRSFSIGESGDVSAVSEVTLRTVRVPAAEAGALSALPTAVAAARQDVVVIERDDG